MAWFAPIMAYAAQALPWISAAFSVVQGVQGMRAEKQNQAFAMMEGRQQIAGSEEEAARQRNINRMRQGQAVAAAGAQGTTFEGSPMLLFLENIKQGELEAQDLLYGGRLKKQASDVSARAAAGRAGSNLLGGFVNAGATLYGAYGGGGTTILTPGGSNGNGGGFSGGTTYPGGAWNPSRYSLGVRY